MKISNSDFWQKKADSHLQTDVINLTIKLAKINQIN